jgi:lipoprotein-anchoring transpeptidase ErfK/SrfK
MRVTRRALIAIGLAATIAAAGSGCALTDAVTGASTSAAAAPAPYSWVAQAVGRHLVARQVPNGRVVARLANPNSFGDPLTVMAIGRYGDWLKVLLPVRPNGSTGWVPYSSVRLMWVAYRVEVSRSAHQLVLYYDSRPVFHTAVAVGAPSTPTPLGTFYLTTLLKQPQRDGPYGPYAFGLSGFSPVLRHFDGGPGQIGLHGTDDPASLGHSDTHGCIRVSNRAITILAGRLPLGTPLDVTR